MTLTDMAGTTYLYATANSPIPICILDIINPAARDKGSCGRLGTWLYSTNNLLGVSKGHGFLVSFFGRIRTLFMHLWVSPNLSPSASSLNRGFVLHMLVPMIFYKQSSKSSVLSIRHWLTYEGRTLPCDTASISR